MNIESEGTSILLHRLVKNGKRSCIATQEPEEIPSCSDLTAGQKDPWQSLSPVTCPGTVSAEQPTRWDS